jgi:lysophospholipase L1-like esterase
LYAGDNDIAAKKTPEQVLEDYTDFVNLVRKHLPQTKIIYLPIKPSPSRWSMWKDMKQANRLIKLYTDSDHMQYYADTATPMIDSQGKPLGDLFVADSLHLSKKGYDLWSEVLEPILDSLTMMNRIKIFGW